MKPSDVPAYYDQHITGLHFCHTWRSFRETGAKNASTFCRSSPEKVRLNRRRGIISATEKDNG